VTAASDILHATLIATFARGGWRGALLIGPSGAGKSDLALRCVEAGWRLVADDRVRVFIAEGRVFGCAPRALKGLIELRGQGMAVLPTRPFAEIVLVARLRPPGERQPPPDVETIAGAALPAIDLAPLEASAPARLRARAV
jgi:serine kinase of HPr protein (carbohydrate metabolism regulator)